MSERQGLVLDRPSHGVGSQNGLDSAAFGEKHQNRSAEKHDTERRDEGDQGDRLRHQRISNRGEDISETALQKVREISAKQHGNQNRRTDDRHCEQRLESGLGGKLNRNDRPVGRRQETTAFEQQLQVQSISL